MSNISSSKVSNKSMIRFLKKCAIVLSVTVMAISNTTSVFAEATDFQFYQANDILYYDKNAVFMPHDIRNRYADLLAMETSLRCGTTWLAKVLRTNRPRASLVIYRWKADLAPSDRKIVQGLAIRWLRVGSVDR